MNVNELGKKVNETLETFKQAERDKMRRQAALNRLIRTVAEVASSALHRMMIVNEVSQRLVRYCSVEDATLEGAVCCR